jgi:uncharacterized membrane protein (DUF485 family)
MRSILVGGIAAAVVMFVLGFIFFGLLHAMAFEPLPPEVSAQIQTDLGGSLAATGSYMIPGDDEAWMKGPGAVLHYVVAGGAPSMPMAMILGFLHMVVSAMLLALGLRAAGGGFDRQSRIVLWVGLAAALFMHLGDPIWYGFSWRNSLFLFVADGIMLIAGGLVLARWFTSDRAAS